MILNPNCSEYIYHIKLTEEEKKLAVEMAKVLILDEEDLKWFLEHESSPINTTEDVDGAFTNEEYVKPYSIIKTAILTKRGEGMINEDDIPKLQ